MANETVNLSQLPIHHKHPHRPLHYHYSRHKSKHTRHTYKHCLSAPRCKRHNKILRTHPPQVSSTEENLPRHTRRTLAQLRTNKSSFLLSYLHKIDASANPSPLCPLCRTHEHTTQYLFSCPQICTTLSTLDLWRDPSGVAALLDDWQEKLAANPHKATETDSPNKQGGVGWQQQHKRDADEKVIPASDVSDTLAVTLVNGDRSNKVI